MGSTRAVIGLGFQLRELLFGDEFVSNSTGGDSVALRSVVGSCAKLMGLGDAYKSVIDHMDVDEETSPHVATLHLVDKHVARLLLENLASSSHMLTNAVVEPMRSIVRRCRAEALGDMAITGRIYVTWADAVSAGKIFFGSAAAVNAFLHACDKQESAPEWAATKSYRSRILSPTRQASTASLSRVRSAFADTAYRATDRLAMPWNAMTASVVTSSSRQAVQILTVSSAISVIGSSRSVVRSARSFFSISMAVHLCRVATRRVAASST